MTRFEIQYSPDGGKSWPWHGGVIAAVSAEAAKAEAEQQGDSKGVVHGGKWVPVTVRAVEVRD